jgi:hypothetical protein
LCSVSLMPPEEIKDLMIALNAWCKADRGRQKELAESLEVSASTLANWFAGHRIPGLGSWLKLKEFAVARGAFRQPEPGDPEKNHMTTNQIQNEKPMNTSAQSKQESRKQAQKRHEEQVEAEGSPALKAAVAEGKMRLWTAVHICNAKVPYWLQATVYHRLKGTADKRQKDNKLNASSTTEDRRELRIAKRGAQALKRALEEKRITKGLAGEIVNDVWPRDLQAFFCASLFGYEIDLVETKKE